METSRLSSKGQITIPQAIRETHKWFSGIEFAVIDTDQGILLTPLKLFKLTSIQEVLGCAGYKGKKKLLRDVKYSTAKAAKKLKVSA